MLSQNLVYAQLALIYVLTEIPHFCFRRTLVWDYALGLIAPTLPTYYLVIHFRICAIYNETQLVDIFAYELILSLIKNSLNRFWDKTVQSTKAVLLYTFNNLFSQEKYLLFTSKILTFLKNKILSFFSIVEFFPTAGWLEREIGELFGVSFLGKKDTRNLMLQYGDSSAPFLKAFPSSGLREYFFSIITGFVESTMLSFQQ